MKDFLEETVEQVDKFKNYYEDHISIDHENLFDDIDNEFEENTAFWMTIILVIVLIIISIAIMIIVCVYKKNKNENEDEEEKEEKEDSSIGKESGVSATSAMTVPVSTLPSPVSTTTGPVSTIVQMPTAPMNMGGVNNIGLSGMNPPSYDSAMQMPQPAIAPYNPDFDGKMKF